MFLFFLDRDCLGSTCWWWGKCVGGVDSNFALHDCALSRCLLEEVVVLVLFRCFCPLFLGGVEDEVGPRLGARFLSLVLQFVLFDGHRGALRGSFQASNFLFP